MAVGISLRAGTDLTACAENSAPVRERPNAHGRAAIAEVVLEALESVRPSGSRQRLSASSLIADSGIDSDRFLDAISWLEGRYQMRFHASWLTGIRTCGDLMQRVADHMFDAADRAASRGASLAGSLRESQAAASDDAWPECRALEDRFAALDAAGLESPFLLANERGRGADGHDSRPRNDHLHEFRLPRPGRPPGCEAGVQGGD